MTPPPTEEPGSRPEGPDLHVGLGRTTSGRRRTSVALQSGARATARGMRGLARATSKASGFTVRQARRAARAEGAGDSGLSRLIELHAFNAAGDAAVAISLAGTLFFQVPTGEARSQVALFLGLTMLPFAIVAPLIGPFLDRFNHGRRWAIGTTMAIRGFLAWVLAGAVSTGSTWLFPAALGVLVSSKAYAVTRAAAVPRLLPGSLTLVRANGRISLAGVVGAGVSAPIAALASLAGPEWSLRYAFVLFVVATVLAILLPSRVDSALGEGTMTMLPGGADAPPTTGRGGRLRMRIPGTVSFALRANCGPRWLSGFLTMFMAFLLRENPIEGWSTELLLGLVIGAARLGNTVGIALASLLKRVNPQVTVVLTLAAAVAMSLAALLYGVVTAALLGLTAGLAQSWRSCRSTPPSSATCPSACAPSRGPTRRCSWPGWSGLRGHRAPAAAPAGLGVACGTLAAWLVFVLATAPGRQRRTPAPTLAG
ncbi:MAG: MFS transporter [Nocardioides sp.]